MSKHPGVLLETERMILRRFKETDADNLFALDNDPEVMRFINGGILTPQDVFLRDLFPVFLKYDPQYPGYGFWALIEKSSGTFLGWLSFRPITGLQQEVIIGFRLRKTAWGKGYASEGARAMLNKGFRQMGVERVQATTYQDNLASQCVLEKLGMRLVRRFRYTEQDLEKSDTFYPGTEGIWEGDDLLYTLDKADWIDGC
jgi:RimJ/RimL family protein N-acetyltransferase